jgi:cytosine/adenosine deaminase-related metal-dependent hydrolase
MSCEGNAEQASCGHQEQLLCGARVAIDPWHAVRATLWLRNGKIEAVLPGDEPPTAIARSVRTIDLRDHLILPGLINAHDHLQFGMFPRLGQGPYPSWREWARDIYRPHEPPLRALLDFPKEDRLWWGAIRNALSGVTTVCHHDASQSLFAGGSLPVTVHSNFGWAHSLDDENWFERYSQTPRGRPFIVHCAEGLDAKSRREAAKLERRAGLDSHVVLVHAVGISRRDWLKVRAAGAWIVWCPSSNLHILGRTLARDLLMSYPSIALGSDSPISAAGDLLNEIDLARQLFELQPDLLYRMVTTRAAQLLRLAAHAGTISAGGAADLLLVNDRGLSPCESLVRLAREDIAAVLHEGRISVASDQFYARQEEASRLFLCPLEHCGLRWHVAAPEEVLNSCRLPVDPGSLRETSRELTNQ